LFDFRFWLALFNAWNCRRAEIGIQNKNDRIINYWANKKSVIGIEKSQIVNGNKRPDCMKICIAKGEWQNLSMKADWKTLQNLALREIETTLEALPKPLQEQAKKLPVTLEKSPNADLQLDGIEANTLGLFTGAEFVDEGATVLPAQIILFLENIWDFAEGDEEVFCEEVRTTFLHELGHFFGLSEDDLVERWLD